MKLPKPVPGLVVCHSFLWNSEYLEGRGEGKKDRPTAILVAAREVTGEIRVYLLGITHSAPRSEDSAVEIPNSVKRLLGLDDQRSWIVVDEANDFIWPGYDLREIPGSNPPKIDYGVLPPGFFNKIREAFVKNTRNQAIKIVPRD